MSELNLFATFPISNTYNLPIGDNQFDFITGEVIAADDTVLPMAKRTNREEPLKYLWIDCASDVNVEVRFHGDVQYKGRVASDGFYFNGITYDQLIITTTAVTATQIIGSSSPIAGVSGGGGGGGATGADVETLETDIDGKEALTTNSLIYGRESAGVTHPVAIDANGVLSVNDINDPEVATTPVIYNVTMTNLDIEYSQALPANTKKLEFRCQDIGFDTRYAYVTGKVATPTAPYGILTAGEIKTIDGLNLAAATLYFACSTAGKIFQIEAWT